MIYKFNNTVLDTEKYFISTDGIETSVEPQVFNLILYLIENKDRVVSRDELLDYVWQGRIVSDTSINNSIKSARKALGDDGNKQQVIKTIHSRGYQFIAELTDTSSPAATQSNETRKYWPRSFSAVASSIILLAIFFFWYKDQPAETVAEQTHVEQLTDSVAANAEPTSPQRIAVLPFANSKPNPDTDYLGFALANQIISDLNYLDNFSIRPAASIRKFVDQVIDPIEIAQELNVDYVINGNYLMENNIIRLNVEMVDVNTSQLVWREAMQVNYSNTFELQDMVAKNVAQGLDVGFNQNFLNQQHRDIPNNALAFEYYLRGISYPQSNEGHRLAVEMLQKSIELDPQYAPSYAHLGFQRRLLEQHGRVIPSGLKDAEWYYQKSLELNPIQLEALSNLSALYTETNRTEDAMRVIRKMLAINPDDANSHFALGYIYRYAGMLDEAIAEMEMALRLSPNNKRFRSIISTYISAGRFEDALNKVYLDPGDYGTGYSGMIAFEQEQFELAQAHFEKILAIDENGIWGLIAQIYLAVMADDNARGLEVLSKMVDSNVIDAENMYYYAHFYCLLKKPEPCLAWLEKAVDFGYYNYPHITHNAAFNLLQSDGRYIKILKQAKQKHDAFRAKYL